MRDIVEGMVNGKGKSTLEGDNKEGTGLNASPLLSGWQVIAKD